MSSPEKSGSQFDDQVYIPATISMTTTMLGGGIIFSPKSEQYFDHNLCTPHRITTFEYGVSYYGLRASIPVHQIGYPSLAAELMSLQLNQNHKILLHISSFQRTFRERP
jgi:hypothetical protein